MGFVYFYDDTTMGTLLSHSYLLSREIKRKWKPESEVDILMSRCKDLSQEEASQIIQELKGGIDRFKRHDAKEENKQFETKWYFALMELKDNQKEACLRNLAQLSRDFIRKELKNARGEAYTQQLQGEDAQLDKLLKEENAFREEDKQKYVCDLFFEKYAQEMAQQSVKAVMQSAYKLSETAIKELSDASDEKAMIRALAAYIKYREYALLDSSAREMSLKQIGEEAAASVHCDSLAALYYTGKVTLDEWITGVKEVFKKLLQLLLTDQTRLLAKVIREVLTVALAVETSRFVVVILTHLLCWLSLPKVFYVLAGAAAAYFALDELHLLDSSAENKIYELLQLIFKNIQEFFASAREKLCEMIGLQPEQVVEAEAQVNKLNDMLAKEGVTEEEAIEAVRRMQQERAGVAAENEQTAENAQTEDPVETEDREKVEEESSQKIAQRTPILA